MAHQSDWGLLAFSGADAVSFLQGYFTADVERLTANQLTPTALCNLKGRVVANGWAWLNGADSDQDQDQERDQVMWLVHRSLTGHVIEFLSKYLAFAKADVADVSEDFMLLTHLRGNSEQSHAETSNVLPNDPEQAHDWLQITEQLYILFTTPAAATRLWADAELYCEDYCVNEHLIEQGRLLIDAQRSEKYLPQMLNLPALGAVDFDKGCYLGQEVVARAEHRGAVKRQLVSLVSAGPIATLPTELALQDALGKNCGDVVAHSHSGMCHVLAVVKLDSPMPLHWGDHTFTSSS